MLSASEAQRNRDIASFACETAIEPSLTRHSEILNDDTLLHETSPQSEALPPASFKQPDLIQKSKSEIRHSVSTRSVYSYAGSVRTSRSFLYEGSVSPHSLTTDEYGQGLTYQYMQGQFEACPDFTCMAHESGVLQKKTLDVDEFDEVSLFKADLDKGEFLMNYLSNADQLAGDFALKLSGWIRVPFTGAWTFFIGSNDGSCLYINGKKLIDNDGSVRFLNHSKCSSETHL
jgi:hypothetical protein